MEQLIALYAGVVCVMLGAFLGYYARQSIARKKIGSIEQTLQKKIKQTKNEAEELLSKAKEKALRLISKTQDESNRIRQEFLKREQVLLRRDNSLDKKSALLEREERDFRQKVDRLKEIKENIEEVREKTQKKLEEVSGLKKEEAKKELLKNIENEYKKDILEKIKKLDEEGIERFEKRAKEILAFAIEKYGLSQAQDITTATVTLPSDEIKGRIIGREGRNIRTLEKMTGVEILVDDTPGVVIISGFNPIRRQIAKVALEKLIVDGRIQPTRIEDEVAKAEEIISAKIKEMGEAAIYDAGVLDLNPKLIQVLGRLHFRTSYGQNVLLHSIEVSHLASSLASELGANVAIAKKAGLLHDIGKALDRQVEGSHVDIGVKILEKFGAKKEIIDAMKSHHEEYEPESLEAVIVKVADQISGARPGARKDTLENYLQRLQELENIATSFSGIEKAYAIRAGREIRVFVKPNEIDDLTQRKLAKEIANRIQEELHYPGEIKVNVLRENRVVEYAR